ncbi:MAG: hypothetical protein KJ043_12425, partial [Anaerolineae bacterium]|nr:hypothetical protein [Anaerolineae bacterium]
TLHSHMSGIAYTANGEKEHLPLNEADLRYKELMQAFVDNGVEGTVGVEAPEPFHVADCMTFQATYRRLMQIKAGDANKPRHAEEEE